jgi:uncharacterized repeat protein (TIGR01451 family)
MMMTRTVMSMVLVLLLPMTAAAQKKGSIELRSVSEVEVTTTNAKGEKEVKRVEAAAAKVIPGDVVIFTTQYVNIDTKPAEHIVITNPVPEHVVYVENSAEGQGMKIEFSVDQGKRYAAPDKLTKTDAKGVSRRASAGDYTHIRWTLGKPLAPGDKGSVSFRARVK